MVGAEIITMGGTAVLSGIMKWAANKQEHQARIEELRMISEDRRAAVFARARETDVHWAVRVARMIATIAVFSTYAFIIIGPAFVDVTVVYFYHELDQGFWPWTVPFTEMHSFTVGSGNHPIMVTPDNRMVLMAITGFLFGSGTQQKN